MSKFLSSFNSLADKAQSALNSQLQSHGLGPTVSQDSTASAGNNTSNADGQAQGGLNLGVGGKSHTLGNLQHQFRMLQQQYS